MKEKIKQLIKEEINKHLQPSQPQEEDQIHESFVALASIAALAGSWAWLRAAVQRWTKDRLFVKLLDDHDKDKIIQKQIPELLRKFKLVSSLSDLSNAEKQAGQIVKGLEQLSNRIDKMVDTEVKDEKNLKDKALALNPAKEKARLKKELHTMIQKIKTTFEVDIEAKKDQLLV